MTNWTEDYHLLGLGGLTSLITNVQISMWGNKILFECVYDPEKRSPYMIVFQDCREITWEVYVPEEVGEAKADFIGIHLGEDAHKKPAVITTDIFEVSIMYGSFYVENGHEMGENNDHVFSRFSTDFSC
ncbi:MAG: hypothetical protein GDA43_09900 [Hormoscilla sp. SP5CHS1]|nr:hypothetical protein [Hormoscilla sp. SP12CHS1]MBC6453485.1 hypothetical protein [Hormoscilla sp. SP5CHS1]